jgi:hypothetical protein
MKTGPELKQAGLTGRGGFQHEFRVRPHEHSAEFQKPLRVGQTETCAPCLARHPQKITVPERFGNQVYDSIQVFARH